MYRPRLLAIAEASMSHIMKPPPTIEAAFTKSTALPPPLASETMLSQLPAPAALMPAMVVRA